jgi:purine-binding chemotaxis protein CheW
MKNVVVCALGSERYAIELRWVREILRLGQLTPVPTAPSPIAGVTNVHGTIVPVLRLRAFLADSPADAPAPRAGDSLVLLDVHGTRAGLAVDRIDEVTTMVPSPTEPDRLEGTRGQVVPLLDPAALLARARLQIVATQTRCA